MLFFELFLEVDVLAFLLLVHPYDLAHLLLSVVVAGWLLGLYGRLLNVIAAASVIGGNRLLRVRNGCQVVSCLILDLDVVYGVLQTFERVGHRMQLRLLQLFKLID